MDITHVSCPMNMSFVFPNPVPAPFKMAPIIDVADAIVSNNIIHAPMEFIDYGSFISSRSSNISAFNFFNSLSYTGSLFDIISLTL